jgi:hypothetical protein
MFEEEIAQFKAAPLTSIFVLTLVTTVVLRKFWQLHLKLTRAKTD